MSKSKIILHSIINSLAVVAYVILVVLVLENAPQFFGARPGVFGSVALLLLFVVSACIVGLLVLGKPGHVYFNVSKKDGLFMLLTTLVCLVIFTVIILSILYFSQFSFSPR